MNRTIRCRVAFSLMILILCGVFAAVPTSAQDCRRNEDTKAGPASLPTGAEFGAHVALSGDRVLVGAAPANLTGSPGAAYIFRLSGSTWTEEDLLVAADGQSGDFFGRSAALFEDVALVGAEGDGPVSSDFTGAAYVFRRSGSAWSQETKLTAADASQGALFGSSVALAGNVAVVGATGARAAYVYRYNGSDWVAEDRLQSADNAAASDFGAAVAVRDDVIVVGAPGAGAAYVFRHDGTAWDQEAKLGPTVAPVGGYGAAVATTGEVIIVGAGAEVSGAGVSGSAFVYRDNGGVWVSEGRLSAADIVGKPWNGFGSSVDVSGDLAVVGAFRDDSASGSRTGGAYLYRSVGGSWLPMAKLVGSDRTADDRLGSAVAIEDEQVVVAAPGDGPRGSVYFFGEFLDCNGNGQLDECDIADTTSEDCNANGVPDECDLDDGTSVDRNRNAIPDECDDDVGGVVPACGAGACGAGVVGWLPTTLLGLGVLKTRVRRGRSAH